MAVSRERILSLIILALCQHSTNCIQCNIRPDLVYGGVLIDCSVRNLSPKDLDKLPHDNVTSLILNDNNLGSLPDDAFLKFGQLRYLQCLRCNLRKLGVDTLKNLTNLDFLNLSQNYLRIKDVAFPKGFFRHVRNLRKLFICRNSNFGWNITSYSDYIDIFEFLPKLTHLGIDSFSNLVIGKEFLSFTNLFKLNVCGYHLISIANDSLKGFQNSPVKEFELRGSFVYEPQQVGVDVFQYLPNVSHLSIHYLKVGNQNALRMMKPIQGREIKTIVFEGIKSSHHLNLEQRIKEITVTRKAARFLGNICVSNFFWYKSHIIGLEPEAFITPVWKRCLREIAVEANGFIKSNNNFFHKIVLMKNLKDLSFFLQDDKLIDQFWNRQNGVERNDLNTEPVNHAIDNHGTYFDRKRQKDVENRSTIGLSRSYETNEEFSFNWKECQDGINLGGKYSNVDDIDRNVQDINRARFEHPGNDTLDEMRNDSMQNAQNDTTSPSELKLPQHLEHLRVDVVRWFGVTGVLNIRHSRLKSLAIPFAGNFIFLTGKVVGLTHLTTLSIQGSKLANVTSDFFDTFPSLKNLSLRKTIGIPYLLQANSKRLFENATSLEYLDLAENGLQYLAVNTFLTNKNLKYLCLASNRFSTIPFNLHFTPRLEILDLRGNVFVTLTHEDRAAIDDHIILVSNFTILFGSNELSCSCSDLSFIAWLQGHLQHFDRNGNYPCMSQDGVLTNTASYKDVAGFWRHCHGFNYFLVSLLLVCALVAGYLAVFLGMKNKTQIISQVMKLVVPGFRLKTRNDFYYDVCIGYSNQDGLYVRNVLLSYIEDMWHLRTFIHQRDLMQDPLLMSQALRDSWRCLLLITDDFLQNYDMAHNVMKVASFFVSPTNPRSVVVMVEERVQHQIPDYVLQVVDEDNILILPEFTGLLDYEAKEFLRTRLLD